MVAKRDKTRLELAAEQVEKPPLTMKELTSKFRQDMADAMLRHMNAVNPDQIFNTIIKDVKEQRDRLMGELLGVTDKWGKVEFDNCNGRRGAIEAKTMERFSELIEPVIREEIAAAWKNVESDKNHKIRVAIRNSIKTSLTSYSMEQQINERCSEMAKSLIDAEIEAVRKEMLEGDSDDTGANP